MASVGQYDPKHCMRLVALHDPLAFRSAMFAPLEKRAGLFALYALRYEILRIPSMVREPALGYIRVQWWRDALHALCDDGDASSPLHTKAGMHPVLQAIHPVFREYSRLLFPAFDRALRQTNALMDNNGGSEHCHQVAHFAQHLSGYTDNLAGLYLCNGKNIVSTDYVMRAGAVLFEAQNFAKAAMRKDIKNKDTINTQTAHLSDLARWHCAIFSSPAQRAERLTVLRQTYEAIRASLAGLDLVIMPAIVGFCRIPALLTYAARAQRAGRARRALYLVKERVDLMQAVTTGRV